MGARTLFAAVVLASPWIGLLCTESSTPVVPGPPQASTDDPEAAPPAAAPAPPAATPAPDGAPVRWAGRADLVLGNSTGLRFDHFGVDIDGGESWDDAAGAADWSADILVGGGNVYDSSMSPPSNKLDVAALFLMPPPSEFGAPRAGAAPSSPGYLRFEGLQNGDRFGRQVAFVGDLDGKDGGRAEIAISAPRARKLAGTRGHSEQGSLHLFTAGHFPNARAGDTISASSACLTLFGEQSGDRLGWALASLDFDGDGIRDLAVGAPGCLTDPLFRGRVYLLPGVRLRALLSEHNPGRRLPIMSSVLGAHVLEGRGSSDRFGYALASLGDLDGDGRDELAVGAPSFQFSAHDSTYVQPHPLLHPPRESLGYVAVFRGYPLEERAKPRKAVRRAADLTLFGEQPGAQFGASLAGGVDMDGDGLGELVVGAPFFALPATERHGVLEQAGRASVHSLAGLAPGALVPGMSELLCTVEGDAANQRFGSSVVTLRDVDGDGLGDFALCASQGDRPTAKVPGGGTQGGHRAGRVWIYRGPGAEGGAACLEEIVGEGPSDHLGTGLAALGDLDGNGLDDLGLGAPGYPYAPGDEFGRVYVILH